MPTPRHDVIVLGAGMAGISAALHLRARDRSVVVVDRTAPGRETSYGNAGIIQSEAVEPYAMPRDSRKLVAMALGRTNDVRYRLAAMPGHLGPLARYWHHSAPVRHRAAIKAYAGLIGLAAAAHGALIDRAGCGGLVRRDGYRVLHRSGAALEEAAATAERLRAAFGLGYRVLTPAELGAAEPALRDTGAGALQWTDPWSVRDPGALVASYAALLIREGGALMQGDAASLVRQGAGWRVVTADGPVDAAEVVVSLGPWTGRFMKRFGRGFPMIRKRGYHAHYASPRSLELPMLDPAHGYVLAPMQRGTRITTGAELTGPESPPTPVQLRRAEREARALLELGDGVADDLWVGTRPCMPDMIPVIGRATGQNGMWLHFGHGHQGFTLGPATGGLLADLMTGEDPFLDMAPFRPDRYRHVA